MQEFKSPVSRLARFFQNGRDAWKEKALERQQRVRALEIKIRDLTQSRANWKARALVAEAIVKAQSIVVETVKKK
jgi:uncharacterized protein with FMN-binding domain